MQIVTIKSEQELDEVLQLVFDIFPKFEDGTKYSRAFWLNRFREQPELLLHARENNAVVGAALAWVDHGQVTLAFCCVADTYRGKGIGTKLVLKAEEAVRAMGYDSIVLGSKEGAEKFYGLLGYTGSLLIQSEIHSIDQLKSVKTEYEVAYINVYEETVNQVCLKVSSVDKSLQRKYQEALPGCHTLMIFRKLLI